MVMEKSIIFKQLVDDIFGETVRLSHMGKLKYINYLLVKLVRLHKTELFSYKFIITDLLQLWNMNVELKSLSIYFVQIVHNNCIEFGCC